jgi:hypothetical protein
MRYPEPFYLVEPVDYHESALTLRTIGWTLLVFDAMLIGIFTFISWRDGSLVWPIWAVVQALVGLALIGIGAARDEKATILEAEGVDLEVHDTPRFDERPPRAA